MPTKPKRPCRYPGCPRLTSSGVYCPEHAAVKAAEHEAHERERAKEYDKFKRDPDHSKKYGRAWKRIRDRYARAHPFCEECFKQGIMTPVEEVHHIIPVSEGGRHTDDNLMSLCQSCHTKIHIKRGDRPAYHKASL